VKSIIAALTGFVLAIVIVACGGPNMKRAMPAPANSDGGARPGSAMPGTTPHAEIEQLDADIKANLDRLQVPAVDPWTASATQGATDPRPFSEIRTVCTPPSTQPPTCGDVCNLGTHICDNADRICLLASELQPDEWATGKCEDGKKSCESARKRCCDCR
jgi:hypothetical protein